MTIPASQLVDITPRVIGGGLSGLAFNGTFISKDANLPANVAVPFYSLSSVGDYFGTASQEYKLAGNYFLADSNASRKPTALWFFKYFTAPVSAFIRGSKPATLDTLTEVSDGSLVLSVDGSQQTLSGLNFSTQNSYSGIATVISNALDGAVCSFDSNFQAFVIKSETTGAESTITFATAGTSGTDVAGLLGLTGGTISQGSAGLTLTQTMENMLKSNTNFWSFMPVWEESQEEAIELATWCNTQGVRFLYALTDKNTSAVVANNPACLAQLVSDFYGVACQYNTKELSAMLMGIGGAIDPNQFNGRKTWAYRQQSGLAYTCDNDTEAQNLLDNGYNFYGNYATASNQFKLFQNGQVSGNAKWLDTYYGQIFIKDGLQNAWINAMINANTIPYNQTGYGVLKAAAMDVINTALNAGFIRTGVSLSESQKATVQQEAGLDISSALEVQGWYLQILDPDTTVRAERGTPIVNFWYMDGGSIQKITGTSTVLL